LYRVTGLERERAGYGAYHTFVPLVGRVLLVLLFLVHGIMKLNNVPGTAGYMAKVGLPAAELMAYVAIVVEIGGALFLMIGWQTRKVAWFLVLYIVLASFLGHRFWELEGAARSIQLQLFLKNIGVIGGLMILASYGPGRYSIDKT
jgi:putative oxidoreductase